MSAVDPSTSSKTRTLIEGLRSARVYDLAQPLEAATPVSPSHPPFRMALLARHGDYVRKDGGSGAYELCSLGGHTGTHIDALSHISQKGKLFEGVDAGAACCGGRFTTYGVETIAPILRRGVLLDVAAAFGVATLAASTPIDAAVLQRVARDEGVSIQRGDVVLVHTGWPVEHWHDPQAFVGWTTGVPGVNADGAQWLASQGIFATGSDTIAYEWLAPGAGHSAMPCHRILLVENGIHIMEVMNLEPLAQDRVYEFAFVAAPLKIVGGTGSPIRPLALA